MPAIESVDRIEPAMLEDAPAAITDILAELAAKAATLGSALHPRTASNLANLVRVMNTYYSNLIEGHNTRPRDIERALAGELDRDEGRRNLQLEAKAHIRVQADIDRLFADGRLPDPTSSEFILRYRQKDVGKGSRILALPAAHHRLNYIHPFPDGNGRVSRLMSHAMAHTAGIGAHGLWSVSRGLSRGLESRGEYKRMMDYADTPRLNDLDGRGNLSLRALTEFTLWFLRVCLDQVNFMSSLFEIEILARRFKTYVQSRGLKPESSRLLDEALVRGQFERGEISRITGLPDRTARRVLNDLLKEGLLASTTPKTPVSLRFPSGALEDLFPRLYLQA